MAFEAALNADRGERCSVVGARPESSGCCKTCPRPSNRPLARARKELLPDEPLIAAEEALLALDSNDVDAAARLISEAHVLERVLLRD